MAKKTEEIKLDLEETLTEVPMPVINERKKYS